MAGNNTYFIGDIHLGAPYISDPKRHERRIVEWLRSITPDARTLFILGDALDYWYEYRYVVPRGYVRFFAALADMVEAGVRVVWITGNHDIWSFGYLSDELGVEIIDHCTVETIGGKRFYIAHGDIDGESRPSYRRMQRLFRSRLAQRLFSAIHPRWTVPFAHRWSGHSRVHGTKAPEQLADSDPLIKFARRYNADNPAADYFVFGHRHIVAEALVTPGSMLYIIGDAFSLFTYARFDGNTFEIKTI